MRWPRGCAARWWWTTSSPLPLLQRCGQLGADVIVYSGTKHIDGQGRVLGGAILGTKEFIDGPV